MTGCSPISTNRDCGDISVFSSLTHTMLGYNHQTANVAFGGSFRYGEIPPFWAHNPVWARFWIDEIRPFLGMITDLVNICLRRVFSIRWDTPIPGTQNLDRSFFGGLFCENPVSGDHPHSRTPERKLVAKGFGITRYYGIFCGTMVNHAILGDYNPRGTQTF